MKINARINYPCMLSKEPDDVQYRSFLAPLELREVSVSDLRLAYRVAEHTLRKDGKADVREYYFYNGKVYRKQSAYDMLGKYLRSTNPERVFDVTICCDPMPNLKLKYKYIQKHRDEAVRLGQEFMDSEYLLVDGEPYVQSDLEPVYSVYFEELRKIAGIAVVFVKKDAEQKKKSYFSALDKDAAIAKATALAELMSDSPLHEGMIEDIEVFIPKLLTYPRCEPVNMIPPLEMHIEGIKEPEYRCPRCYIQLAKGSNVCPTCKDILYWEEPVKLTPGEVRCTVCDGWLATINRDGSNHASSHYNGTAICDSCMVEHCVQTNCFACKLGSYPDCQFQEMKKFYLQPDD